MLTKLTLLIFSDFCSAHWFFLFVGIFLEKCYCAIIILTKLTILIFCDCLIWFTSSPFAPAFHPTMFFFFFFLKRRLNPQPLHQCLRCTCSLLFVGFVHFILILFANLAFYAASADSTAQTGHAGAGDWQEEIYQMVRHDTDIILFGTPFLGTS